MANLYKASAERTETVIRSHDPHFMENLANLLEGKPVHSTVMDELSWLARDLREVLKGQVKSSAKEL